MRKVRGKKAFGMTSRSRRLAAAAAIGLFVLVVHGLLLWALSSGFDPLTPEPLPPPIYTRLLEPAPPAPPVAHPAPPRPQRAAPHRRTHPRSAPPPQPQPPAPPPPAAAAQNLGDETAPRNINAPLNAVAGMPVVSASIARPTHARPQPQPASAAASSAVPVAATPAKGPSAPSASTAPAAPVSQASNPAGAEPAPGWPPSTQIDYALTGYWRGALHGSGELVWTREGDHYEAHLSGRALVSFSYASSGRIQGDWLAPEHYAEQLFLRHQSVTFDRPAGVLHFDNGTQLSPIPPDTQDSASLFLQIAHRLAIDPGAFTPGATLSLQVARPTGLSEWAFTVVGQDTLDTPLGPLRCWRLERPAAADNQLGAVIWLAPELENLPVRIRLIHGSDSTLEFNITQARQAAPAAH